MMYIQKQFQKINKDIFVFKIRMYINLINLVYSNGRMHSVVYGEI